MLKHYDDGKKKQQSHEVWIDDHRLDSVGRGYGATKEEAYEDYKNKLEEYKRWVNSIELDINLI